MVGLLETASGSFAFTTFVVKLVIPWCRLPSSAIARDVGGRWSSSDAVHTMIYAVHSSSGSDGGDRTSADWLRSCKNERQDRGPTLEGHWTCCVELWASRISLNLMVLVDMSSSQTSNTEEYSETFQQVSELVKEVVGNRRAARSVDDDGDRLHG